MPLGGNSDLLMSIDLYEVRPRKDHRGVDLISAALPFGRLWYGEPNWRRSMPTVDVTMIDSNLLMRPPGI